MFVEETREKVSVKDESINMVLSMKATKMIPLDGIVMSRSSSLDESSYIGESLAVEKEVEANVWDGTMNLTGNIAISFHSLGSSFMKILLMSDGIQVVHFQNNYCFLETFL